MTWRTNSTAFWYAGVDSEANDNAVEIYNQLASYGFSYNAICGVLGNIGYESGYNPWMWQGQVVLSSTDYYNISHSTGHAYGLLQFDGTTGAGRYINNALAQSLPQYGPNFSDITGNNLDGYAQLYFMEYYDIPVNVSYIQTTNYPLSYSQYKSSTASADYLARAWFYNYERGTYNQLRDQYALYWYNNLNQLINGGARKMPWIYYMKRRRW